MRCKVMMAAVMIGCFAMGHAQMSGPPKGAPVGSTVAIAKAMDEPLVLIEYEMMGVVKAMPADKYSFAPSSAAMPGTKFDGVRTFVQEVTHVAEANYYFYSSLSGLTPDVDMKKIETITTKDEAVAMLAKSFAFAHKAIATITPENAFVAIKAVDGMDTRVSLAAFGVAHGYDHYGQMVEYLRMTGMVPPGSK
jgi:uncharacterized damage-inducible protein DinB